jgi:hypothetical protein
MGIPLRHGELFTRRDDERRPLAAIVNETLARRHWHGEDALGKRLRFGRDWLTVRGVVGNVRHHTLAAESDAEIYVSYPQLSPPLVTFVGRGLTLIVRTAADTPGMPANLRAAVRAVDPGMAVRELATLDDQVARSTAQPRLRTSLVGGFSILAMLLAAMGIYGVMAHLVAERTREIGVRLALGASPRRVLRFVLGRAARLTAWGAGLGVLLAVPAARLVDSLLFDVTVREPVAYAAAPLIVVVVALAASLVPARRAAAVDPLVSLRSE